MEVLHNFKYKPTYMVFDAVKVKKKCQKVIEIRKGAS